MPLIVQSANYTAWKPTYLPIPYKNYKLEEATVSNFLIELRMRDAHERILKDGYKVLSMCRERNQLVATYEYRRRWNDPYTWAFVIVVVYEYRDVYKTPTIKAAWRRGKKEKEVH